MQGLLIGLVNAVPSGNLSDFDAVAFPLQHRRTFGKFHCFFYRVCFDNDVSTDRFLDVAKRAVDDHLSLVCSFYCSGIIKWQSIATDKFVLCRNAANPVHCLFHPYLDLFGRGYFVTVFVPENQNEFVHDVFVLVVTECLKYRLITNENSHFGHVIEILFKDNDVLFKRLKRQKRQKGLKRQKGRKTEGAKGVEEA